MRNKRAHIKQPVVDLICANNIVICFSNVGRYKVLICRFAFRPLGTPKIERKAGAIRQ